MNILVFLYHEGIYRPLFNGLVFIYSVLPYQDLGLAILVVTVLVRLLLHPTVVQTIRSQQAMARLQPQLQAIQKEYKGNKEEQARRTMALYREAGVHPLSGCIPLLIQLPILIGLYRLFTKGIRTLDPALFYAFTPHLEQFHPLAFGLIDLTEKNIFLAIAAGASQFLQAKFLTPPPQQGGDKTGDFARAMQTQALYVFPVIIIAISWSLPAAVAFYWTVLNLLAIVQQLWIQKRFAYERRARPDQPSLGENGHPR